MIVGDRGMITQKQINALHDIDNVDWITALRTEQIRKLADGGQIQMGLFDERNLFEVETHPDFPAERLVACRNPALARLRAQKRQSLLEATSEELRKVQAMVERGRLRGKQAIEQHLDKAVGSSKLRRHIRFTVRDDGFDCSVDSKAVLADTMEPLQRRLDEVHQRIDHGQLHGTAAIGVRIGKVINKYKIGKHFVLDIRDDGFDFSIDDKKVVAEAALDGIYVVRTSLPKTRMDTDETVRSYSRRADAGDDEPTFHMTTPPNRKQQQAYDLLETIEV